MELWVRSQNREMLRINPELEIYEYGNEKFLVIDTKGYTNYDKAKVLGEYKTKRKALEVLDEIQKLLEPKIIYKVDDKNPKQYFIDGNIVINNDIETEIKEFKTIVYTMPKE